MAVRQIKGSWWVDFSFDHTRYRRRSPENSRAGAQAYEAALRHRLARGENIVGKTRPHAEAQSFKEFSATWFDEYVVPNNKFSERKAKRYILAASLVPYFGNTSVGQITTQHIEQFKAAQVRTGVSNKTINNQLTVLNKCLVTAYEWLDIETKSPKVKKLKFAPARMDNLTPGECELLLSRANGVLREMLIATMQTGMRQGEVKGLQWEAINWQHRTLTVRHSWNDELKALEAPKSNRERVIPLSADVCKILAMRRRITGFVFLDKGNKPFSERRLNRLLSALCNDVGLRRVTWHILRHSFATHLMTKGAAPNTVQALLGHASITTTMRYAHVPPHALREAIDLLNPVRSVKSFGQQAGNRATLFSPKLVVKR